MVCPFRACGAVMISRVFYHLFLRVARNPHPDAEEIQSPFPSPPIQKLHMYGQLFLLMYLFAQKNFDIFRRILYDSIV